MNTPFSRQSGSSEKLASILVALVLGVGLGGLAFTQPAHAGYGSAFYRSGAVNYAQTWYSSYNWRYQNLDSLGGDCTNFVSQAWHEGGNIPFDQSGASQWYHYGYWYYNWYLLRYEWRWAISGSFKLVRDFRSYWYNFGTYYKHVEGSTALTSPYSPAGLGDVLIFDSGNNPDAPSWAHASIIIGWWTGYDMYAQHSITRTNTDWRYYYRARTTAQRINMSKPGHGIRVIAP